MMVRTVSTKTTVGKVFVYVLAYAGWILTLLLGLAAIFYTRQVLNSLWLASELRAGLNPIAAAFRVQLYDRVGLVVLLLLWAVLAFYTEYRYRSSVDAARRRQVKEEPPRSPHSAANQLRRLRQYGIDILAWRFLITTSIPASLFALAFLIEQITLRAF